MPALNHQKIQLRARVEGPEEALSHRGAEALNELLDRKPFPRGTHFGVTHQVAVRGDSEQGVQDAAVGMKIGI